MQSLERGGFTKEQVILALHAPHRRIDFRYELLNENGIKKKDLNNILDGSISQNAEAPIKRTAKFTLRDQGDINYFKDRIKPYVRFFIPEGKKLAALYTFYSQQFAPVIEEAKTSTKSGWIEFSLGEYLLSAPNRKEEGSQVIREIEAFDGLLLLQDDKIEQRLVFEEGQGYNWAVRYLLESSGITKINLIEQGQVFSRAVEFEIGTDKLTIINSLLKQINYTDLYVDVNGFYTALPYRMPSEKPPDYEYRDDSMSVLFDGVNENLDFFHVPNKWIVVKSNSDEPPLVSVYTNDNPNSLTSTVNRGGRVKTDHLTVDDAADQNALDAYTRRLAFESSQIFGTVEMETAIMPIHETLDIIYLEYSPLNIRDKYEEINWSFPLKVDGRMSHTLRKVVTV